MRHPISGFLVLALANDFFACSSGASATNTQAGQGGGTTSGGANLTGGASEVGSGGGSLAVGGMAEVGGQVSMGGTSGIATGGAAGGTSTVARPSYNTGTGFFTLNGKLYDANGVEFRINGVNTCHYDQNWASCSSNCGIPNSHANVNRIGMPLWSAISTATLQNLMNKMISERIVPMPGVWYVDGSYADSSNVTCKENAGAGSAFATAVSQWVARASLFKPFEKYMLLNIANEWGPSGSTVWRDVYIDAVTQLRQAGYLCTIVIDAGGCGQDPGDIIKYAQTVYEADPQHNIVFDEHVYGGWATEATGIQSWQVDLTTGFDQLRATGLPILIGEFGPGKNVGPSPTMLTPGTIIQAANAHGFGWAAWAWDDGYGQGANGFELSNQGAFSLSGSVPTNGSYPNNTDLSAYGNEVVLNPTYGTFANARAATIF
jgi:hypothetical protein